MVDVVLISPSNSSKTYQGLSSKYSAIEPPTWALLIAESLRSNGFNPKIMDCLAENLSDNESFRRIEKMKPRLICFVVYGQNVNSGTTNMSGAIRLCKFLKQKKVKTLISFIGSHVQAVPKLTLKKEKEIDFVFLNEGIYSLRNVLNLKIISKQNLLNVPGLAIKHKNEITFTESESFVPNEKMDIDMPGYAWDLLPYKNKPLDLYRSPLWHAEYKEKLRSPYAAIQTSIGCQFKCNFCMINLINKDDNTESSVSSSYNKMRHWSPNFVDVQFKKLISMGIKTIRITDEMFLLNKKYYLPIIENLIKINKYDELMIWAYSRIDTVPNPEILKKLRNAGFRWLCLGIESGSKKIRLEVSKGKFEDVTVEKIVKQIEDANINVLSNYIYGLPGDSTKTIEDTYKLSTELNTLGINIYPAMALPGTPLYRDSLIKGVKVPEDYEEFSFHSYNTLPLPTEHLEPSQILKLRDEKFHEYFERKEFLDRVDKKFGSEAVKNIKEMTKVKLKRKLFQKHLKS